LYLVNALRRFSPPVLAQLFWASNFVVAALVVDEFSSIELTWLRWVGAAPILVLVAWWLEKPSWRAALREWPLHTLQAILGMVGYTLFLYAALATTSPVTASVISAINPAIIALAAVVLLGERILKLGVFGIIISTVGVLIVVFSGSTEGGLVFSPGDLLMLGAISVWTAYVIISRRVTTPPITATAVQAALSIVVMLPLFAFFGAPGLTSGVSAEAWFGLAWIIVFPSALAYLFWNIAVTNLGPSKTGVFLNLLPVFTAVIALAFGDVITIGQAVGGAIVLTGVFLTTRPGATRGADAAHPPTGPVATAAPAPPADPAEVSAEVSAASSGAPDAPAAPEPPRS
jgi:drug/metabolite transporter (DMT)-like permease